MKDFSPTKRSQEFLERLANKNPELAKKYAKFKDIKKKMRTAEHAYQRLQYNELINYATKNLEGRVNDNDNSNMLAEHAASIWFVNQLIYEKRIPVRKIRPLDYNPLIRIGVNNLDDLINLAIEYCGQINKQIEDNESIENIDDRFDCTEEDLLMGFDVFLVKKLHEHDPTLIVNAYNGFAIFPRLFCEDEESMPAMLDANQYYLQQFKRLEREQGLYTEEAEIFFLPILKQAYASHGVTKYFKELAEKRGIHSLPALRDTLSRYLIRKIIHFADPHLPLKPNELRHALRIGVNGEKLDRNSLRISLMFVDYLEEYVKIITKKEPKYLPLKEDILKGKFEEIIVTYGAKIACRAAYHLLLQMPLKEVEHRYSHFSAITHDAVAAERFTSYLFQLARRRRVQLENTMKS